MAKGTPYSEAHMGSDAGRIGRPGSSSSKLSPQPPPFSRTSVLSSVVPYLRRLDVGEDMPAHHKSPLLTLSLSSPSFLDSVISDVHTKDPLYQIDTVGTSTTIKRADPWEGYIKTADIKWPKTAPPKGKAVSDGISIQMRGLRWDGGETLLRRGTVLSSPRKFNIPNYSHNLKWRRVGNSYWCTTSAVKGPIAILDVSTEHRRLNIFETLNDKYDARPMLVHHGVSLLLLDYLLITALLLVTDVQEWMLMRSFEGEDITIPPPHADISPGPNSAPGSISSTSISQWRKIMFGEPLYRKRSSGSSFSSASTSFDALSPTPTLGEQTNDSIYGNPAYPEMRGSMSDPSSSESDDEGEHMFFSPTQTRPPSPSAESIFYPLTPSTAPSHTYLDPSFYGTHAIPPVPPIPARYGTPGAGSSRGASSRPSSSHSVASSRLLPVLPVPIPIAPLVPRPRSTPPRSTTLPEANRDPAAIPGTHRSLPASRRLPEPSSSHPNPVTRGPPRQLPRPPSAGQAGGATHPQRQAPSLGRSRSQSMHSREKWSSQYRQRTLPAPPPAGSSAGTQNPVHAHEPRRRTPKEVDDLSQWVHTLTNPRDYPPVPLPGATFDTPPPAYNTIDFRSRVDLSSAPPLQPPIPPPLSSRTGAHEC